MKGKLNELHYIVADDFTGANDVGVALASSGITTQVLLSNHRVHEPASAVSIVCTDSRDLDKLDAKQKLLNLSKHYQLADKQPLLIKKIDSTLRGNIGCEIEGLLESGYKVAIVAMAAPNMNRKTVDGICYVNNAPLSETEFASDPKSPILSSRITDIIAAQSQLLSSECFLSEKNEHPIEDRFNRLIQTGVKIIVCDAQSHRDLSDLYSAASKLNVSTVFVTTGEITGCLIQSETPVSSTLPKTDKPTLSIIGSMSEMTLAQSQYLLDNNISEIIDLDLASLLSRKYEDYLSAVASDAIKRLCNGKHCVIRSCSDSKLRHKLKGIALEHQLSQIELAEHVRDCLAELAAIITTKAGLNIGGMILCGGDIALATARKLDATIYEVGGVVAECVPWGTLESRLTPFPIFTKAGGFGKPATFHQVIKQLQEEVK